jgi:hypothetical protein
MLPVKTPAQAWVTASVSSTTSSARKHCCMQFVECGCGKKAISVSGLPLPLESDPRISGGLVTATAVHGSTRVSTSGFFMCFDTTGAPSQKGSSCELQVRET